MFSNVTSTIVVALDGAKSVPTLTPFRAILLTLSALISGYLYLCNSNIKQIQQRFAREHNCQPCVSSVPHKWPFAIDLLIRQFKIMSGRHALEGFTPYAKLAGTVRIGFFGLEGYFTSDPENIKTILDTNFEHWGLGADRNIGMRPLIGEGIFLQDGDPWRHSRRIIHKQFSRVQRQTIDALEPNTQLLLQTIREKTTGRLPTTATMLDLKPLFFAYTLNNTTDLLFGESRSSLPVHVGEAVHANYDFAAHHMSMRMRFADFGGLYNPKGFRTACKDVREWAAAFASKALQYKDKVGIDDAAQRYPFILELWKEMKDKELVRDQLLHILLAGRDSTAALMCWLFFHIIRHPGILERLKKEIAVIPLTGSITREQIHKQLYLRCCINEILRLYPTLPLNTRHAKQNTILPTGGGPDGTSPMMIRKGTGIGLLIYHMHHSESIYGNDAKDFKPERWEGPAGEALLKDVRSSGAFVDFNIGPRSCLGKDFALMEASYAAIRILQAFPSLRLPTGTANEPVGSEEQIFTLSVVPGEGVLVAM